MYKDYILSIFKHSQYSPSHIINYLIKIAKQFIKNKDIPKTSDNLSEWLDNFNEEELKLIFDGIFYYTNYNKDLCK